jgi:hypothetical protein
MTKVFISGSMRIKNLDRNVTERLDNIINSNYEVIVGDANGVDSSIQNYLYEKHLGYVTIYCTGNKARNNIGNWKTHNVVCSSRPGTREFYTAKDLEMAENCDYGFMIWDTNSIGTLKNTFELLARNKKSLVYINKVKEFLKIKTIKDLEKLMTYMSEESFKKADEKLNLNKKVEGLKYTNSDLFIEESIT